MNRGSPLYQAMAMTVNDIADMYNEIELVEHRFSWRYKRKEKAILKAYLKSKEKKTDFNRTFAKISLANKIRFAVIMILAALLLAGCAAYIVIYVKGIKLVQYDTHSSAFSNIDETIDFEKGARFVITYDLSDYTKEVVCDDEIEYWVLYRKGDECVNFRYMPAEYYGNTRYNTENSSVEIINIDDIEAIYYTTSKGVHCLIWSAGGYVFDFDFTCSLDQAIQIIETIEKN
jgi:hypothetical protein